jgi:hypothetical protein
MTTFIEDSPRNVLEWIPQAVGAGHSSAAVLSPWATPFLHPSGAGKKAGIEKRARALRDAHVKYWVDPMTHALQMPGVGDYRYYSQFNLWGGPRGDVTDPVYREEHVRRVFRLQDDLGAPHLGPTLLLNTGLSNSSSLALDLARVGRQRSDSAHLSVAGSGSFWSSGADLDSHIGALASLEPRGWFLSFTHAGDDLPPAHTPEEIAGICRTTRALSEYAPVYVSHGDLAALPAIAAGAFGVGTGWDKRQRVIRQTDYQARIIGGHASWYERPTILGLMGTLSTRDGALLKAQAPDLLAVLGGHPAPGPGEAFAHHVAQLHALVGGILAAGGYEARFRTLDAMYGKAESAWSQYATRTGARNFASSWVTPFRAGLRIYARSEGW